jgi:hypothetical protein
MKPALVFLSGAWFVLHLLNRQTRTGPLTGRLLLLLVLTGAVAVADAGVETAYLVIPKKEVFVSTGCCTEAFDSQGSSSRFLPGSLLAEGDSFWLSVVCYGINACMVLALAACARLVNWRLQRRWLAPLLLLAVLSVVVNIVFLLEVGAPLLLHLPNHHCPYDLVPRAPESLLAIALFLLGSFTVGWACVTAWLGHHPEAEPLMPGMIARLCRLGVLGYSWSTLMITMELLLT